MSNRLSVLTALDKHGKSTYGELEFNTGLTRKQLLQAVNDAKKVGHILSGKDELTGQPAYTITAKGREWMAAMPQTVEVKLPIPTAVSNPVVKESSTTEQPKVLNQVIREFRTTEDENLRQQVAHLNDQLAGEKSNYARLSTYLTQAERQRDDHFADAESANKKLADLDDDLRRHVLRAEVAERNRDDLKKPSEENHRLFLAAISDLAKVNETLELDPNDGGAEPIISAIDDLKSQLETAETAVIRWLDLAREYECKTIPELRVFIGALVERIESLREQLNGKPVDASLPMDVTAALQYVVRTPSKPPRFTKKQTNAHAVAMSAARQHGFAEVFALVPVGKAVRGAEWVAK